MTEKELRSLVEGGESETLEFKTRADGRTLARLIAAFANGRGGHIVLGYDELRRAFTGVHPGAARSRVHEARQRLTPKPDVELHMVSVDDRNVAVVHVRSGNEFPYLADGVPYVRTDAHLQTLTADAVVERATQDRPDLSMDPTVRRLAETVERMAAKVETLEQRGRLKRTVPVSAALALLGAAAGYAIKVLDPLAGLL